MAKNKFDELNILSNSSENFDYREYISHYFDTMQISNKRKRQRIEQAEELFDTILYFLVWCEQFPINEDVIRTFENKYAEVVYQVAEPTSYIHTYIPLFINNLVSTTLNNIDEEYFTSVERAAIVASNEANTIYNFKDLQKAKDLGYTYKTWVAEIDNRTRADHIEMNGQSIPIDDWFVFEDCMMLFPHDEVNGTAYQLANCRCSLQFS